MRYFNLGYFDEFYRYRWKSGEKFSIIKREN